MSVEIHAGIVEGVITGVVVLLGIGLTEWAQRVRDRRRAIEEATINLVMQWPHVLAGMGNPAEGFKATDTSIGSEWWERREEVVTDATRVRVLARRPLRRSKKIRREAESILASQAAAEFDLAKGRYLSKAQVMWELPNDQIFPLVFGKRGPLDEAIKARRRA